MKTKNVALNNRKKSFEVKASSKDFLFPYAKLVHKPSSKNKIIEAFVDNSGGKLSSYVL